MSKLVLDLTETPRITLAAETVDSLDVLINNAGVYGYEELADRAALERHLAVNSEAAAFSLTQSLRATLAGQGVDVRAVLPGPVDTDMVRDLQIPKASPQSMAAAILDGLAKGKDDIFPDPFSQALADSGNGGAVKALERRNAALITAARIQ
ncbi:hypothetical protein [Amycolatopsis sp. CA-128772]|uniref:hypothetical protein n=1 Tax=Amycolatopsis sp. CA-128772 TaxID=2073159 RepID=UPI000CD166EF|nr:hypothetical protein [Amycolatopsis sp. CA-128772]